MEQTFGETINLLREKNKLTLKEVATSVGIDTSMLGKIEKGTRKANPEIIQQLSLFFEISEKELRISMISDLIAKQVIKNYKEHAHEILKVAERKVAYQKSNEKIKN